MTNLDLDLLRSVLLEAERKLNQARADLIKLRTIVAAAQQNSDDGGE